MASPQVITAHPEYPLPKAEPELFMGTAAGAMLAQLRAAGVRGVIEQDFVNWRSPAEIAKTYKLSDRSTVYRHAHAFNLFGRRRRNVRAALERVIEKSGEVEATAASVAAAVQVNAKINAAGRWIDRNETVNVNELFDRMTDGELETYARDGNLPEWFQQRASATPVEG